MKVSSLISITSVVIAATCLVLLYVPQHHDRDMLVIENEVPGGHASWWGVIIRENVTRIRGTALIEKGYFDADWQPLVAVLFSNPEDEDKVFAIQLILTENNDVFAFVRCTASTPPIDSQLPGRFSRNAAVEYDVQWKDENFSISLDRSDSTNIECPVDPTLLQLNISSGMGAIAVFGDAERER